MSVSFLILLLLMVVSACSSPSPPPPDVSEPDIDFSLMAPAEFELSDFTRVVKSQKFTVSGDVRGYLFENCEVSISGNDLEIRESKFVNTQVFVGNSINVTFNKDIFEGLNLYEKAALSINDSTGISVWNCQFLDNYIGLGIHSSRAYVASTRFVNNNGHNALVIGERSYAIVEYNYFYGSFPHAILVMNREALAGAYVGISFNIIESTGEDAIDFEDYRDASPSIVRNNFIVDTGWSAIVVEYNSWDAHIAITDNWIENTGISWSLPVHSLQTDVFQPGWGHGIMIEDSTHVVVARNNIKAARENGIEVRNGQDITLSGNIIDCEQIAVAAYRYRESSLTRAFSPLWPDRAGGSKVNTSGNIISGAQQEYESDEASELSIE